MKGRCCCSQWLGPDLCCHVPHSYLLPLWVLPGAEVEREEVWDEGVSVSGLWRVLILGIVEQDCAQSLSLWTAWKS